MRHVFWSLAVCLLLTACTIVPPPVSQPPQTPRPASSITLLTPTFFDKSPQVTIESTPSATVEATLHIDRTNARYDWLTISDGRWNELAEAVVVAADGSVWIGASGRASHYTPGGKPEWQPFPIASSSDELMYEKFVGVCTPDATVSRAMATESNVSDAFFCEHTVKLAQPKTIGVRAIATAPDGSLWFGTYQGVVHYVPGGNPEWTTFTVADGLLHDQIDDVAVGPDGSVWVIAGEGVRYKDNVSHYTPGGHPEWATFPISCVDDCYVETIAFDAAGSMWFGTGRGVSHYTPGGKPEWETLSLPNDDPWEGFVSAIAIDPTGSLWFGGYGSVSHYMPGGNPEWETFAIGAEKPDMWPGKYVRTIAVGRDRAVWVGTMADVRYYAPGSDSGQKAFTIVDGLANQIVNDSAVGPDGSVWLAVSGGVIHVK